MFLPVRELFTFGILQRVVYFDIDGMRLFYIFDSVRYPEVVLPIREIHDFESIVIVSNGMK